MDQKFVNFEEALEKLGISADKLNELRERGELRAYRDGASWKFRGDEIKKMMDEGIPDPPPPSDIGLIDEDDLVDAEPLEVTDEELELSIDDSDDTKISGHPPVAPNDSELEAEPNGGSELELAELDDTVTAGASDLMLEEPGPADPSDSILLSEEQLGESVSSHGSTVIGKDEIEDADLELELADDDDLHVEGSDVKLAGPGASDVLSSKIAGSGVLDTETSQGSGPDSTAFEDLEELEIDLAAESSRILSPEDAAPAEAAKPDATQAQQDSDLRLDDDGLDDDSNMGSTDVPILEVDGGDEAADEGSGGEIDLAGDSELELADGSGSDITLDSGDSGINLVSPADSGLALDDIPLDIGGSAILSSLSLSGDSDPEISLLGDSADEGAGASAALQTDEDFQLTPLSEGTQESEGDSSSQVIALDAEIEEMGQSAIAEFEEVDMSAEADDGVVLSDDFGGGGGGDFEATYSPAPEATSTSSEPPYNWAAMLLLSSTTLFLLLGGVMMLDILRNIWTWNEEFSVSSSLMEALLGAFGLG